MKKDNEKEVEAQKESNQSKFASYFVDYVTQILVEKYGADAIYKDGLQVYTTIDMDMQTAAENAMAKYAVEFLSKLKNKMGSKFESFKNDLFPKSSHKHTTENPKIKRRF